MNENHQLKRVDNAVEIVNKTLTPYRITRTLDSTYYEFWIVKSKDRSDIHDKDIKKWLATIDIKDDNKSFTLAYYSEKDAIQIVKDLPIKDLQVAVNDLKEAGF